MLPFKQSGISALRNRQKVFTQITNTRRSSTLVTVPIMQFKLVFVTAALATLAVATPARRGTPASSCSTGPVQCCQIVETIEQAATDPEFSFLLEIIVVSFASLTGVVGLTCSGVDAISGTW
jgi:hypothetical protein